MPASPSRNVIELSQTAVDMRPGSKNQMPGSSFDHSAAETPPLVSGTSIESPVLLSVIVMDSATSRDPPVLCAFDPSPAPILRLRRLSVTLITGESG
jgi:hypothetical protein